MLVRLAQLYIVYHFLLTTAHTTVGMFALQIVFHTLGAMMYNKLLQQWSERRLAG